MNHNLLPKVLLASCMLAGASAGFAAESTFETMVSKTPETGAFGIVEQKNAADIVYDEKDWPGVIRAVKDLSADVKRVTGVESAVKVRNTQASKKIVIGTIGKSAVIDALIADKKLNVDVIQGKWESYLIEVLDQGNTLAIVGSDKRGTIYGIYELSERMGVSPWYWWADVPARHSDEVYVRAGRYVQGPPKVKFRGIFINDEEPSFGNWSRGQFGGINSKMYAHMFELILRLKGNYLWPAMWGKAFNEDDPLNPVVADEYGVVMGTSHHEPMMRNQQEWTKRSRELGEWNYRTNTKNMQKFWLDGLTRNAKYDNLPTVGLRGDGDLPLDPNAQFDSNKEMLYKLFQDQENLIRQAYGRDPSTVPQMWVVFNEIWTFYNRGVRPPDNVNITFSDSNFGYLLQLPTEEERKHPGGLGLYYHIDMNGGPWNDRWISTREIPQIWQQLYLAYEYGIRGLWIVNVGDLKPKELEIDFFLKYAWDPDKIPFNKIDSYMLDWAKREFPAEFAEEIVSIVSRYIQLNHIRKPEIQQAGLWSAMNFNEADRFAAEWQKIADRAEALKAKIPNEYADAFYQLVYYPAAAGARTAKIYTEASKLNEFVKQGRASASVCMDVMKSLMSEDKVLSDYYNSKAMAGGKWNQMMSDVHIGYTQWSMPRANALPRTPRIPAPADQPSCGVAAEGGLRYAAARPADLAVDAELPYFDSMENQDYAFTLFNRSDKGEFTCKISADQPWIKVSSASVSCGKADAVVRVSIDWDKVPNKLENLGRIAVVPDLPDSKTLYVGVAAGKGDLPKRPSPDYHFYANLSGVYSIPACGFTKKTAVNGVRWEKINGLGRGSGDMVIIPAFTDSVLPPAAAPALEYNVFFPKAGEVTIDVEILPIFPENPTAGTLNIRTLRLGTALDNDPVQVTDTLDRKFKRLNNEVFENIRKVRVKHTVKEAGLHTFKVVMVDPAVTVERIVVQPESIPKSYLGMPDSRLR